MGGLELLLINGLSYQPRSHFGHWRPKIARRAIGRRGLARSRKPDNWVSAKRQRGDWGLFHRDPKRIVGVLRVTLLNRLNGSREWAELPLGR
jgi:hypothetical protein